MRGSWQTRLAAFAKRHPVLRAPVFALLWAGFKLSAAAEACGQKWSDSWDAGPAVKAGQYSWRLRVLSLSMALLVGFAALPAARYYAEEAPPDAVEQEVPPEPPATEGEPVEEGAPTEDTGDGGQGGTDPEDAGDGEDTEEIDDTDPADAPGDGAPVEDPDDSGAPGDEEITKDPDDSEDPVDEDPAGEVQTVITGFAELGEELLFQDYPVGTPLEEIVLPESLEVALEVIPAADGDEVAAAEAAPLADDAAAQLTPDAEGAAPDAAPLAEAGTDPAPAADGAWQALPVSWLAQPDYDELLAGTYLFTPVLPEGLVLAEGAVPPAITVALTEDEMDAQAAAAYVRSNGVDVGNNLGTESAPFRTLQKAMTMVDSGGTIFVMDNLADQPNAQLPAGKSVIITAHGDSPVTVVRDTSTTSAFIEMVRNTSTGQSSLTLTSVVLDGGSQAGGGSPLISVSRGCRLTLGDGAVLQNNINMAGATSGGGAINAGGGTITMESGSAILGNQSRRGGGVFMDGSATLNVKAGSRIEDNTAVDGGDGGGVAVGPSSTLALAGGAILGNIAEGQGKDVFVGGDSYGPAALQITSGVIGSPTEGANAGGGLYVVLEDSSDKNEAAAQVVIGSEFLPSATTIYVDPAFEGGSSNGDPVAFFSGYGGNPYVAAARFISPSNPLGMGTVDGDYVRLVPPSPVKVHTVLEGTTGYAPSYWENLDDALAEAAKDTTSPKVYVTLRANLTGITSATRKADLRPGVTVLRSELPTAGSNPWSIAYAATQPLFTVDEATETLTLENVTLNSTGATTAITVSAGKLTLAGGTITAAAGQNAVSVSGGSFDLSSGAVSGGTGIEISATGTMEMTGGKISGTSGMAVRVGGTAAGSGFVMEDGLITAAGGGVQVGGSRTFTMSGGTISANTGSGVQVLAASTAVFNLSGGSILNHAGTPGVHVAGGTAALSGGTISGNGDTSSSATAGAGAGVHMAGGSLGISGNVTISGSAFAGVHLAGGTLTMSGGAISGNTNGSGLYAAGGTLKLTGGAISGNETTGDGAGLHVTGGLGTLEMGAVTISGNTATGNGGGVYLGKNFSLAGGTIKGNTAGGNGGGLYSAASGTLTLAGVTVGGAATADGNTAVNGGGVYMVNGTLALRTGTTIGKNTAGTSGGGVYVLAGGLDMAAGTVSGNTATAGNGGGIYLAAGSQSLTGGTIKGNVATAGDGGGLYSAVSGGTLTLAGVTVGGAATADGNTAVNGGGAYVVNSAVTLEDDAAIGYNTAGTNGGGIYVQAGSLVLGTEANGGAAIDDNEAGGDGGGAYLAAGATLTANDGDIRRNTAAGGGGLYTLGTATLAGTGFEENEATAAGGGLYAKAAASLGAGTGFDDNTAAPGLGGAIYLDGGSLTLAGGRVGDGLRTNAVARKAGEVIRLAGGSSFDYEGTQVMLERATAAGDALEPYKAEDVILNSGVPAYPDWLVGADFTGNEAKAAGCFWTDGVDTDGSTPLLMRGVWVLGDSQIVFQPASIQIYYPDLDETEYASKLEDAFIAVATKAGLPETTGRLKAHIIVGENVSAKEIAVKGNADITLMPDTSDGNDDATLTVTRGSNKDLFTLSDPGAPKLSFQAVTVNGAVDGGSLFKVESGGLVLDGNVSLVNAEENTTLVSATGGTVTVNGPAISSPNALANFALSGNGGARLQLYKGHLGPVSCAGNAAIHIPGEIDDANCSVQMLGSFTAGEQLAFVEVTGGSDLLKARAAPCFTGKTGGGKPLVGGVKEEGGASTIVWLAIVVRMQVTDAATPGNNFTKNYTSLDGAFTDLILLGEAATAAITVLENFSTGPQQVPDGIALTIGPDSGTKTITRASAAGDLFSFEDTGSLTLAAGLVVDGGSLSQAGGALVAVGQNAGLSLLGTLQNNKGTNGGAIRLDGGTATLGATAVVKNNTATSGGGVYNDGGTLTLAAGGALTGNTATNGGGVYQAAGSFNMNGGTITGNKAGTAPGTLTAGGSGVNLAGGALVLDGAPVIGTNLLDNNLLNGGGAITLKATYGGAASVQVGGTAGLQATVAQMDGGIAASAAQAATFRDVGEARYYGTVSTQDTSLVVWGTPNVYPVHSWNGSGTAFVCDGPLANTTFPLPAGNLLYLMVDGKPLARGTDYTATALTTGTGTRFVLDPDWVDDNPPNPDAKTGYTVLVMYKDGYGSGAAKAIGLTIDGGEEDFYTTLELALAAVPANQAATITLYGNTAITGEEDNRPLTVTGGRAITLRAEEPPEGTAPHSVLRSTDGTLFTVDSTGAAASLTFENVTVDGRKALYGNQAGSLVLVAGGTVTLGEGATLKNNKTTGNGGALCLNSGAVVFDGGTATGNEAALGGGLYAAGGAVTGLGGRVTGAEDTLTGNAASAGSGTWIKAGATFTVTDGVYTGIVIGTAAGDTGALPNPPLIHLAPGFEADTASILLEGKANGTGKAEMLEGELVALYGTNFPAAAKAAAAACISNGKGLRGVMQSGGAGVILADASSVRVVVPGVVDDIYGSIEEALAKVPANAAGTLTLQKSITMQNRITVDNGRTVVLTTKANENLTALRGATLEGDLFTVTDGGSLTLQGNGTGSLTLNGNSTAFGTGTAKGTLVRLGEGALTVAAGALLKNNATNANGGAVNATGGTLAMSGGEISDNSAVNGGGIYTAADFALSGGVLTGNTATGSGAGVYLAQPAGLELTGGNIGTGGTDDDLFQEAAANGAPALTVAGALTAADDRANLAGWKAGGVKDYADGDLAALLDTTALTYAQRLAAAPQLHHTGAAPRLYAVLDPAAEGVLLRRYVTRTEPLYLEAQTGLGSDVNWTLLAGTGTVTGITVEGTALAAADFDATTADRAALKKGYLDTLENGTYTAVLTVDTGSDPLEITTGFTVAGQAAVVLHVDGEDDRPFRTLAGAIAAAPGKAASIELLGNIDVTAPLAVESPRSLTIYSDAAPAHTLTRKTAGDLFTVETGASFTFKDVTLNGNPAGYPDAAGALVLVDGGSLALQAGATLKNNINAGGPGGVSVADGTFTMAGGAITGNTSGASGGGVGVSGTGSFVQNGGEIAGNAAASGGGVAVAGGSATLAGGAIESNTATADGGGLAVTGGAVQLAGTDIEDNTAAQSGGGIHASGGTLEAAGGTVSGNTATGGTGGGINLVGDAELTLRDGFAVSGNAAGSPGAGIYLGEAPAALTLYGGQVGDPAAAPFDGGIAIHVDNPPVAGSGFGASAGHNLNIERLYDGSGNVDFGDETIPVALRESDKADYGELVTIAGAIRYQATPDQTTYTYSAVAVPDADGNFTITTVADLFDCFTLYRRVESDPLVYWRFAGDHNEPDAGALLAVNVADLPLTRGTDYIAERGSIQVTLQESYLKTLKSGVYIAKMYLTGDDPADPADYSYLFRFVVQKRPSSGNNNNSNTPVAEGYDGVYDTKGSPQTGDGAAPGLWLGTALASLLALLGGLLLRLRRKKNDETQEPAPPA